MGVSVGSALQGDVESIAMMKPIAANEHEQGFLEYLEDIIGTERFKKPLELLNLKVEELSAMWAEKVGEILSFNVLLHSLSIS